VTVEGNNNMEEISISKSEKILIVFRDSIWILFIYIILRGTLTSLFIYDVNLNITLKPIEKIFGVFLWFAFLVLTILTQKLHKKLKTKFGKILLFNFPKNIILFAIIEILLLELFILTR
jgi:hypothetical protein